MRERFINFVLWLTILIVLSILVLLLYGVINPLGLPAWVGTNVYQAPDGTIVSPPKTLWDLISLLIIPIVLALVVFSLNRAERQTEQKRIEGNENLSRKISFERNQETILQAYIDRISELMVDKDLCGSEKSSPLRAVARTQTRTVLYRLTGGRKGLVIRFLREAGLIADADPIIHLAGVDLREAKLKMVDLSNCNLSRANLSNAELERAKLIGIILVRANLSQANLTSTDFSYSKLARSNFSGANLSKSNLRNSDLIKANFSNANLNQAIFDNAKLNGATFSNANLLGTKFGKTNIRGADFTGAKCNSTTTWPDGFDAQQAGIELVE